MRICLSVTEDGMWRFTSYPSEPILSCAATDRLHHGGGDIVSYLSILNDKLRSGMIDKGQRGELTSRLLLLLAVDYTRLERPISHNSSSEMPFAHPVKLVDYLRVAFGVKLEKSVADVFEHAYVNATHWVSMSKNIQPSVSDPDLKSYKQVDAFKSLFSSG